MFLTVQQQEANVIKSIINSNKYLIRIKKDGLSPKEVEQKALTKSQKEIALYKKQAKKAYETVVYTTLDDNDFYTGMEVFNAPFKDLKPIYSGVRSFYGKARTVDNGKTINLISYDSCVLSYNRKNNILLQNEYTKCSPTTRRHVVEFLEQLFGSYGSTIVYDKLD